MLLPLLCGLLNVVLYRARLPLSLKSCLALARSNYHRLAEGSRRQRPAAPAPHLRLQATLFWTLAGRRLAFPIRKSTLIMQSPASWVIATPVRWKISSSPLVFYQMDTCQAGFHLIRRYPVPSDWRDKGPSLWASQLRVKGLCSPLNKLISKR